MSAAVRSILSSLGLEVRRVNTRFQTVDDSVRLVAGRPNMCLISPEKQAASETFIRAHRDLIEANVFLLHGGSVPHFTSNDRSLLLWGPTPRLALRNYLLHNRIDVVLAEYGTTGADIFGECQAAGVPLIVHFHGFDASSRSTLQAYAGKYREMFAYASHVVGVSREMVAVLAGLGCPQEKLVYNPCGPDESFLDIEPDYESSQFLSVGRLVSKKAPYLTLAAFNEVHRTHPRLRLVMAGDGELMDCCLSLVRYWGLQDAVDLLGAMDHDDVRQLFSRSFCFLQHSVTALDGNTEGTPVGLMEACASGLPVVATSHAGIKDVILDGQTGLLVDERDVHGMARCMQRVADDRAFARRLGQAARARVREHFAMSRHIGILSDLVRQCVRARVDR